MSIYPVQWHCLPPCLGSLWLTESQPVRCLLKGTASHKEVALSEQYDGVPLLLLFMEPYILVSAVCWRWWLHSGYSLIVLSVRIKALWIGGIIIIYTRTDWLYFTYELDLWLHIFFIQEIILHWIFITCTILDIISLLLKVLHFIFIYSLGWVRHIDLVASCFCLPPGTDRSTVKWSGSGFILAQCYIKCRNVLLKVYFCSKSVTGSCLTTTV